MADYYCGCSLKLIGLIKTRVGSTFFNFLFELQKFTSGLSVKK